MNKLQKISKSTKKSKNKNKMVKQQNSSLEKHNIVNSKNENILDQLNQVKKELQTQLRINKEQANEKIKDVKTQSVMTKYQMVFLKIEIYLVNIKKIFQSKIYFQQSIFFYKIKLFSKLSLQRQKITALKVYYQTTNLQNILHKIKIRNEQAFVYYAYAKIKFQHLIAKIQKKSEKIKIQQNKKKQNKRSSSQNKKHYLRNLYLKDKLQQTELSILTFTKDINEMMNSQKIIKKYQKDFQKKGNKLFKRKNTIKQIVILNTLIKILCCLFLLTFRNSKQFLNTFFIMSFLKYILSILYNAITFPFYLLTNIIPKTVDKFIQEYYKDRLQVTRKNCWFLINPKSGKKIGREVIEILKTVYNKERILDLTEEDYVEKVLEFQEKVKEEFIYIVIGGGDGTQGSIMKIFFEKSKNFKQLVFVPMPLGTGNDFSRSLGLMGNLGIDYLYRYFVIFNSEQLKPEKYDAWIFNIDSKDKKSEEVFLCYLGLGMEAQISYCFDQLRKRFPGLFFSKKTNMAIYTLSYFYNHFLSLFKTKQEKKFNCMKLKVNGEQFDTNDLQNITIMNCFARQGMFFQEWDQYPRVKDSKPQKMDDGLMEMLTLQDYNHLAMTTIYLRTVGKGRQGSNFQFEIGDREFYYHLDGEPYRIQGPAKISLKFWNNVNVLKINY